MLDMLSPVDLQQSTTKLVATAFSTDGENSCSNTAGYKAYSDKITAEIVKDLNGNEEGTFEYHASSDSDARVALLNTLIEMTVNTGFAPYTLASQCFAFMSCKMQHNKDWPNQIKAFCLQQHVSVPKDLDNTLRVLTFLYKDQYGENAKETFVADFGEEGFKLAVSATANVERGMTNSNNGASE